MGVLNETVYMYISGIGVSLFYIREDVIDSFEFKTCVDIYICSLLYPTTVHRQLFLGAVTCETL